MRYLLLLLLLPFLLSCLWDTDTIRDEIQNKAGLYDLIIGQVPKHSDSYYEKRLADSIRILAESKRSLGFNTIATAHIRLGQFNEAEEMLRLSLRKFPGDYYTLSNLGILYKKKGDFSKAAKFIEQALKIRPEGHMGLGDWYLKMLLYRANEETFEKKNFLGQEVLTKYLKLNKYKGKEKYFKLIKLKKMVLNDQHFADGFLALADFLSESGELNLALRAYMRAEVLGHSKSDYIQMRFNAVFKHVKHLFKDDDKTKSLVEKQREIILNEFKKAEQWSLEFQKAEAELIKKYPKAKVEYKHVYKLLKAKKISPYRP